MNVETSIFTNLSQDGTDRIMELKIKTPRRSTTPLRYYKGIFRNPIFLNRFITC